MAIGSSSASSKATIEAELCKDGSEVKLSCRRPGDSEDPDRCNRKSWLIERVKGVI